MKNKKLLRWLAAVTLGAAMATTCFLAVGCGGGNNNGDGGDGTNTEQGGNEQGTGTGSENTKDYVAEFIPSEQETGTIADEDFVSGVFKLTVGTEVRTRSRLSMNVSENGTVAVTGFSATKSVKINGTNAAFIVEAIEDGELIMYVDNGSGSVAGDYQTLVYTKPDSTQENIEYNKSGLQLIRVQVKKGTNKFQCSGTTDLYYAKFTCKVLATAAKEIKIVNAGVVDYFVGQTLDTSKLSVSVVRETTLAEEPIAAKDLTVDTTGVDTSKSGQYTVNVKYTEDGKDFNANYTVNIYEIQTLTLGKNMTVKGANSQAGNGVYKNVSLQQFYFKGETISTEGMSLNLKCKLGEAEKEFINADMEFNLSTVDMTTAGKKTVEVSLKAFPDIKDTFDIYVADKTAAQVKEENTQSVAIKVDAATTDANVGVKVEETYRFKTLKQAIDFLDALQLKAGVKKTIELAAGTYSEKIEINIPNLTLKGAGADTTKLEWDSLYGKPDESGYEQITDSSATLNIRDGAVGFTLKDMTVSNKWNSLAYFDEKLGEGYGEHRALAILIQADKVTIDGCTLLGYQDTIELFTGRQVIKNTLICGTTDFIFGTNNTTYFYNCEIRSVNSGKTDGGYITAFKGCNKGETDYVTYGAIFDNCNFTCEEGVVVPDAGKNITTGNTAIARPWGAYAAVAVINSQIGGHVSTVAYSGQAKNQRYVEMSGNKPNTNSENGTTKFVEYNNTGDGAITEAVNGMIMLDAAAAANYSDFSVIFGKTNGKVTYGDVWDGESEVDFSDADNPVITENTTFNFRKTQTYTETTNAGETNNYGKLVIKGNTSGSFKSNGGDWYVIAGDATLELQVTAGTTIVFTSYEVDSLEAKFNGTVVTPEKIGESRGKEYSYTATEDGTFTLSKLSTFTKTAYVGVIEVTVGA